MVKMLADFYGLVEREGRWPEEMGPNLVAMLPKGGTDDPMDRRPIVLLSTVYRVWAAVRAAQMRCWLKQCGVLAPTGPERSAEGLAYSLALEILVAQAEEERLAGVAYDWSKCYDRLPLRLLREVAEAAGVPARLVEPMLHAYGLPRRVICEGLAGEVRVPTHGLTPGCPAATDWLALLMTPWLKTVRGQGIAGKRNVE